MGPYSESSKKVAINVCAEFAPGDRAVKRRVGFAAPRH